MTTRTERTRCLHELQEQIQLLVHELSRAERIRMAQMIFRHYPCAAEWDAIAELAPEWLETTEAKR